MAKDWILSKNTLNLSNKKWNEWLSRSKASEKSKKRYLSERKRFKEFKKQISKIHVNVKKVTQKEGYYGRSVWYAKARKRIYVLKSTYQDDIKALRPIFNILYCYKRKAKFLMLKIKYRVIVSGKVWGSYDYLGSTVQYANEFNYAYDNLIRKIKHMIYSASIQGIVIYAETIKFYAGKRIKKNA